MNRLVMLAALVLATTAWGINPLVFGGAAGVGISTTIYASPVGSDVTEGIAQVPTPTATYRNLRCVNNAIQGNGHDVTITVMAGTCGSQTASTVTCTITGTGSANASCSDTNAAHTATVTNGQCIDIRIVTPGTLTANAVVSCVLERSA